MSYSERADPKDPAAIIDMSLDFATNFLAESETITERTVTCDDERITIGSLTDDAGVVRWRVGGGAAGTRPIITCSIETSAGRAEHYSIMLPIRDR